MGSPLWRRGLHGATQNSESANPTRRRRWLPLRMRHKPRRRLIDIQLRTRHMRLVIASSCREVRNSWGRCKAYIMIRGDGKLHLEFRGNDIAVKVFGHKAGTADATVLFPYCGKPITKANWFGSSCRGMWHDHPQAIKITGRHGMVARPNDDGDVTCVVAKGCVGEIFDRHTGCFEVDVGIVYRMEQPELQHLGRLKRHGGVTQ